MLSIECCLYTISTGLIKLYFVDEETESQDLLNPSGSHCVEVALSQPARTTVGRSLRPQIPPSPSELALGSPSCLGPRES